jgi:hypothetical protein
MVPAHQDVALRPISISVNCAVFHSSYLGRTLFPLGVSVFDSMHLFGALSFALCTMQQIFICEREGASCVI